MDIHVYILRCQDGSYYTGLTRAGLETRIGQHNSGTFPGYTFKRRPVELLWSQEFSVLTDAIAVERQIKGWNRAKKEALIAEDWETLCLLSHRGKANALLRNLRLAKTSS